MASPHWSWSMFALAGLALGAVHGAGCGDDGDCTRGEEGCYCTADYRCLQGLACRSFLCVDLSWTPESAMDNDDDGDGDDGDDGDDDDGGFDNVAACEDLLDALECTGETGDFGPGLDEMIDCEVYAEYPCALDPYYDCLADNTECNDGVLDVSGWTMCAEALAC